MLFIYPYTYRYITLITELSLSVVCFDRQSIHILINKNTYMFMDKGTLMTIKKTIYKGYSHTCDIITVYKLTYHDIRLDILICLKITTVLIYNCMCIRSLLSTETHI